MTAQMWVSILSAAVSVGTLVFYAGSFKERLAVLVKHAERCEEKHEATGSRVLALELFRAKHEANGNPAPAVAS